MGNNEIIKNVAKELAKDIYNDGGKGVVQETGKTASLVPRAIRAALSPLEKWIMTREYNIEETRKLLEWKLENFDPEAISSPEPYIAVPTVEYLSYCMDNGELRNMYANLLANSMIDVVKNGVHPGFVEIIKQLSPDEARILKYMENVNSVIPTITIRYQDKEGAGVDVLKFFSSVAELAGCESTVETEAVFDNLERLGLIIKHENASLVNKELYKPIKESPYIVKYMEIKELKTDGRDNVKINEHYVELSSFGKAFCSICVSPPSIQAKMID